MGIMNKIMNFIGLQEEEEITVRERIVDHNEEVETNPSETRKTKGNIVSIHSQKNVRVILNEPRSYEETQEIADHLRSRRPVIVNLHRVKPDQAMRIVDFLSGTVYALSGTISKVGPNIFFCTPDSVEVQGTITDMQEDHEDYNKSR
jgi:cell division inhibitor SepF